MLEKFIIWYDSKERGGIIKKILLVGDLVSYGKIALSSMIPLMSSMKLNISHLPAALVSNTFDYGEVALQDTTEYMKKTIEMWKRYDFQFDMIVTGFMVSLEQVEALDRLIAYHHTRPIIVTDPIMGDDGTLYHGLDQSVIEIMQSMSSRADVIVPNVTEICYLLDMDPTQNYTKEDVFDWIHRLQERQQQSVLVTSVEIEGASYVLGMDAKEQSKIEIRYEKVPAKFAGTGDIFTSLVSGFLMKGDALEKAVDESTRMIYQMLLREGHTDVRVRDVSIEEHLEWIGKLMSGKHPIVK